MNLLTIGIDEAGRGCVLGPMVVAAVGVPPQSLPQLQQLGVKDSKQLSPKRRQYLSQKIQQIAQVHWIPIPANTIDQYNLTYLSQKTTIELIQKFLPQPLAVYLDVPTRPAYIQKYLNAIQQNLPTQPTIQLQGTNRAENQYPTVAAASIIAKVIRDQKIQQLKQHWEDFGSGYPHDPKTKKFLQKNLYNLPNFVRTSWKTIQHLKQKQLFL